MNYYDMEQLSRIEPAYLAAFGLNAAPFSPKLDDRFYFQTSELSDHLQLIRHLIRFGNLMLMVIGENGVGKTSFKNHLLTHADENWHCCEIEAHTMMDSTLLLRDIVKGFAISNPPMDPNSLYRVLENQLQHLQDEGRNPVLAIDNAHELPKDSLEVLFNLSNYNTDTNPLIRILLFCEPQIEAMLDSPAISMFRERVTHRLHLSRLSEEETAEYLRHRMAVAGLDGTSPFTPRLVKKIYRATAGNPAKINEYAHSNLQDDSEPVIDEPEEQEETVSRFTPARIVTGGIALALIVMVLLFQQKINSLFEDTPEPGITEEQKATTPSQPQVQVVEKSIEFELPKPVEQATQATPQETVQNPPADENRPDITTPAEATTPTQLAPVNKQEKAPVHGNTPVTLVSIDPAIVTADNTLKTLVIKGEGFHDKQQVLVTWTGNNKTLESQQVSFDSDSLISISLNPGNNTDTWTVTLHDAEHQLQSNTLSFEARAAEITVATAKPYQPQGDSWIRQQKSDHYTLQLLGTYQAGLFEQFLRQHKLQGEAASFTTTRNGRPWHTLIYGQYSDRTAAQKVAATLPAAVGKPWLRTFGSIKPLLTKPIAQPTTSKPPATAVVSSSMPTSDRLAAHDAWLWSQHPGHYTLQIMAGKNFSAIQSFWQQHKLAGKSVYYRTRKEGADWYVLLYGEYATRQQAVDAVQQLPTALQNNRPWARPFGDIHSQLQSASNP